MQDSYRFSFASPLAIWAVISGLISSVTPAGFHLYIYIQKKAVPKSAVFLNVIKSFCQGKLNIHQDKYAFRIFLNFCLLLPLGSFLLIL